MTGSQKGRSHSHIISKPHFENLGEGGCCKWVPLSAPPSHYICISLTLLLDFESCYLSFSTSPRVGLPSLVPEKESLLI